MLRPPIVVTALFVALAGTAGLTTRTPAVAQDCVLDRCLRGQSAPAPAPDRRVGGPLASGDFDYFTLALSWSPGFCAVSGGPRDAEQCERGGLGFVVHGLWPQRARGLIENCEAGLRPPARADVAAVRDLFPTEGLARYEWRKHGGCTGL